jgi:chromosomal replication initiation ATPase DnaA
MSRRYSVKSLEYRCNAIDYDSPHIPVPSVIVSPVDPLNEACQAAGISPVDLFSMTRKQRLAEKRFHVMWILRQRGWSYPRIAKRLGRTHHTTALHGVRRWSAILAGRSISKSSA